MMQRADCRRWRVRISSNTTNLVVACESPESEVEVRSIFRDIDAVISPVLEIAIKPF